METVNWFVPSPDKYYYPAMRLDYNATQNLRVNFAFEETRETHTGMRRRITQDQISRIRLPVLPRRITQVLWDWAGPFRRIW